jgi:hypothetical protein
MKAIKFTVSQVVAAGALSFCPAESRRRRRRRRRGIPPLIQDFLLFFSKFLPTNTTAKRF